MKGKLTKSSTGITLIALVITIIVLLILAGVSISMVVGQNGILSNAQNSVIADAKAKEEEAVERSALAAISISSSKGNIALENGYFNQELKNEFGEGNYLLEETTDKFTVTIVGTGNSYEVDKFGNVSGQVPPGGNGGGENTETIVGMYEDLAGDEEGATEGKIHIGDYINYNPNPDSLTTAEMTEENGYKYVSANSETGLADAISYSYVGLKTTVTEQVFTVQPNLKWRVIGMEGSNLLITTETPIIPDSPVSTTAYTGYFMYGPYAYENGIREINNIARIYANGEGAVKASTRGMTITDVDNIAGVVANGTTVLPEGVNGYFGSIGEQLYGTQLTDFQKGTKYGWTPSAWLSASEADRQDASKAPGITEKVSSYYYAGSDSALKTASSAIRNNLVFGASNENMYWLASRGVLAYSDVASFALGAVIRTTAWSQYLYGAAFGSGGEHASYGGQAIGVRPVVALASDVSLTSVSTTDGITTWNIE